MSHKAASERWSEGQPEQAGSSKAMVIHWGTLTGSNMLLKKITLISVMQMDYREGNMKTRRPDRRPLQLSRQEMMVGCSTF